MKCTAESKIVSDIKDHLKSLNKCTFIEKIADFTVYKIKTYKIIKTVSIVLC